MSDEIHTQLGKDLLGAAEQIDAGTAPYALKDFPRRIAYDAMELALGLARYDYDTGAPISVVDQYKAALRIATLCVAFANRILVADTAGSFDHEQVNVSSGVLDTNP